MPDFPVISPGLITCCRPRLSLTSLPRPCPGYYRSLLSLTTSLITCCRPRLSLTSLPRLCPGYYRSPLSLTTSSPISSWLLTCSAPWLHSSSRLPVLHLGPHHTRDTLWEREWDAPHSITQCPDMMKVEMWEPAQRVCCTKREVCVCLCVSVWCVCVCVVFQMAEVRAVCCARDFTCPLSDCFCRCVCDMCFFNALVLFHSLHLSPLCMFSTIW